jgi:hypothetical protein
MFNFSQNVSSFFKKHSSGNVKYTNKIVSYTTLKYLFSAHLGSQHLQYNRCLVYCLHITTVLPCQGLLFSKSVAYIKTRICSPCNLIAFFTQECAENQQRRVFVSWWSFHCRWSEVSPQKQESSTDVSSSITRQVYRNNGSLNDGKQERWNKMQILNSCDVWDLPQMTALRTSVVTPRDWNHSQIHRSVIPPKCVQIFCQ